MQEAKGGGVSPGLHGAEGGGRSGKPPFASCMGEPAVPEGKSGASRRARRPKAGDWRRMPVTMAFSEGIEPALGRGLICSID